MQISLHISAPIADLYLMLLRDINIHTEADVYSIIVRVNAITMLKHNSPQKNLLLQLNFHRFKTTKLQLVYVEIEVLRMTSCFIHFSLFMLAIRLAGS